MEIQLDDDRTWVVTDALKKLVSRGQLPGAYCFDQLSEKLQALKRSGITPRNLLPLAVPGSWLVNGKAPSPVFKKWLMPESQLHWDALFEGLDKTPAAFLDSTDDEKAKLTAAMDGLGKGRCHVSAVSKVLASLFPQVVPLLDDAAVWLLTRKVKKPEIEENGMAQSDLFVPSLEAFCRAMVQVGPSCEALSHHYPLSELSSGQILDRLLWFDSFGHRHFGWVGQESMGTYLTEPGPEAQDTEVSV